MARHRVVTTGGVRPGPLAKTIATLDHLSCAGSLWCGVRLEYLMSSPITAFFRPETATVLREYDRVDARVWTQDEGGIRRRVRESFLACCGFPEAGAGGMWAMTLVSRRVCPEDVRLSRRHADGWMTHPR